MLGIQCDQKRWTLCLLSTYSFPARNGLEPKSPPKLCEVELCHLLVVLLWENSWTFLRIHELFCKINVRIVVTTKFRDCGVKLLAHRKGSVWASYPDCIPTAMLVWDWERALSLFLRKGAENIPRRGWPWPGFWRTSSHSWEAVFPGCCKVCDWILSGKSYIMILLPH